MGTDGVSREAPTGISPHEDIENRSLRARSAGKKKRECSKIALTAMIVLWFIGAFFGMAVVVWQLVTAAYTVNIGDVLMYISGPMTGGIVTYMVKSAVENREKIKKPDAVDGVGGGRGE